MAERAVRPVSVEVVFVLAENGCGMSLVDDQSAVEEFAADAANEAFGDRVGPRCPDRRPDDADIDRGEDGVEGGGELRIAVPDKELEASVGVVEVHGEVASLLGEPGAGRVSGDTEDVHTSRGVLDHEDRVPPAQCDGIEMKQVASQNRVRLRPQKLSPRGSGSTWGRVDAGTVEDLPDRRGADLIAETGKLAVDPSVSPGGFSVARRMTRARTPAGMAGRPGRAGWVVQRRATSCRCQRRIVDGVTSSPRRRRTGSSRVRAAIRARSVQLICGRGVRRRSTASWWRRTKISISFVVSDRARSTIQPTSVENIK